MTMNLSENFDDRPSVVLVTGPSGAGRTTSINVLEDMGYEVINNLPLSLLPRLLAGPLPGPALALGVDVRNRDFSTATLIDIIDGLAMRSDVVSQVLYLDATEETLVRRYSETRRRHPLASAGATLTAIQKEAEILLPIRARADHLIDTSSLSVHDLRVEMENQFAPEKGRFLGITLHSFSYKRGLPRGLDIVLDCRFLRNPHWDPALRAMDGRDQPVVDYVKQDDRFEPFFDQVKGLLDLLLPAHKQEGKSHLSVGFGCTGGQHRSVALVESMAQALADSGWQVSKRHREMERRDAFASADKGSQG